MSKDYLAEIEKLKKERAELQAEMEDYSDE